MRHISAILLFFAIFFQNTIPILAQPQISEDQIPAEAAPKIRNIIQELYVKDPYIREQACVKLRNLGMEAVVAIPFLEGMLYEGIYQPFNPIAPGRHAAGALAEMGDPGFKVLVNALKSSNSVERANAADGLGNTKKPEAFEHLLASLNDLDQQVRYDSIDSIGQLSSTFNDRKIQKKALIIALKDKDIGVQDLAFFWLEYIPKDEEIIQALLVTLNDNNKEIREKAALVLEKETGKKYKWKRWWE